MAAQDFFDSLESRADASKLAGMSNSYLFDIEGEGQWLVDVRDGALTVTPGGGEADATITTSGETFEKIVAGEQNPTIDTLPPFFKVVFTPPMTASSARVAAALEMSAWRAMCSINSDLFTKEPPLENTLAIV